VISASFQFNCLQPTSQPAGAIVTRLQQTNQPAKPSCYFPHLHKRIVQMGKQGKQARVR
jgi:hypothetical protein